MLFMLVTCENFIGKECGGGHGGEHIGGYGGEHGFPFFRNNLVFFLSITIVLILVFTY